MIAKQKFVDQIFLRDGSITTDPPSHVFPLSKLFQKISAEMRNQSTHNEKNEIL
jgi:hypothetical protein